MPKRTHSCYGQKSMTNVKIQIMHQILWYATPARGVPWFLWCENPPDRDFLKLSTHAISLPKRIINFSIEVPFYLLRVQYPCCHWFLCLYIRWIALCLYPPTFRKTVSRRNIKSFIKEMRIPALWKHNSGNILFDDPKWISHFPFPTALYYSYLTIFCLYGNCW